MLTVAATHCSLQKQRTKCIKVHLSTGLNRVLTVVPGRENPSMIFPRFCPRLGRNPSGRGARVWLREAATVRSLNRHAALASTTGVRYDGHYIRASRRTPRRADRGYAAAPCLYPV